MQYHYHRAFSKDAAVGIELSMLCEVSPSDDNSCLFSLYPNISDDSHFGVGRKPTKKNTAGNILNLMDKMASPSPAPRQTAALIWGSPWRQGPFPPRPPWHPSPPGPVQCARSAVLCTVTLSNANALHNTGKYGNTVTLACLLGY